MRRRAARLTALALSLALSAGLAGCSDENPPADKAGDAPTSTAPVSSSPTPAPSPTPPLLSPLTGLPVAEQGRIVAVKVDNAPLARRFQVGLDKADVVYEEVAEAGLTRFLAVYSSQAAVKIGPVRSVRESDLELLRQYGRVLFGFSGGNKGVLRSVRSAEVIDVSYDVVPRAYDLRKGERRDAYNYFTSTARLYAARAGGERARNVGFTFGALPAAVAASPAVTSVSVPWSDKSRTGFTYDEANRVWIRSFNGTPSVQSDGAPMRAGTVVLQHVPIRQSRYVDVQGSRTPYSVTVGGGKADVFRDGRKVSGQWVRQTPSHPTRFVDAAGKDIPLKPGAVWVLLVPQGTRVTG